MFLSHISQIVGNKWSANYVCVKEYMDSCPKKNCPPIRVRFCVSFRVGGQFSSGAMVLVLKKIFQFFPINLVFFLLLVILVLILGRSSYKTSRNICSSLLFVRSVFYYNIICIFCLIYYCLVVMLKPIWDPNKVLQKKFQSATGTLISYAYNLVKIDIFKTL